MITFVTGKAEGLSDRELLTAFDDKGWMLNDWIAYLKSKLGTCGQKIR